ncbi:putative amidoligase enzyme [Clostridium sp. ASBs410]|nr:putative amidoligase enzyme [Clostridium sp. ASBs410]
MPIEGEWDFNRLYNRCFYQDQKLAGIKKYIKSWNYIPKEYMFHEVADEDRLYLGVELEIDSGGEDEDKARHICNVMNRESENIYCKHDGSLNDGFEIVTHPCTLDYHKQLDYEEMFEWLVKNKYRSHDTSTCGLHVHINRSFFGEDKLTRDLCISKLLYLFEKYWDKVELIARRSSNRFARRFLLEEDDTPIDLYAKSQASDKYGAINLKHKDTVEIRIFKGTLNYNTYISTLEFVCAMVKIAKETDIYEIQYVTWDKIKTQFSNELNGYIFEREEIKKKDEESKRLLRMKFQSLETNFNGMGVEFSSNTRVLGTDFSDSFMEAWRNLSTQAGIISSNLTTTSVERVREVTPEERIRREIVDLRSHVRRCRNGLEERNLNRQIAKLEDELRRIRRAG